MDLFQPFFIASSIYFLLVLLGIDQYFNRTVLQVFLFLLPLALFSLFKPELWMLGIIGIPLAILALQGAKSVYAHHESGEHAAAIAHSRKYNAVLVLTAFILYAAIINFVIFRSDLAINLKVSSLTELLVLVLEAAAGVYVIYIAIHKLIFYLITPQLAHTTEIHRGELSSFFKYTLPFRGTFYCVTFEGDPTLWQLRSSSFKQLILKKGSTYEYTVCTGFQGNKFIKGEPQIITEITREQEQANHLKYYSSSQYAVLKWAALGFAGLMMTIMGLIYSAILVTGYTNNPALVHYPMVQITIAVLLLPLGVFAAYRGFTQIGKTAKFSRTIPETTTLALIPENK